jgi:hypothetical protein
MPLIVRDTTHGSSNTIRILFYGTVPLLATRVTLVLYEHRYDLYYHLLVRTNHLEIVIRVTCTICHLWSSCETHVYVAPTYECRENLDRWTFHLKVNQNNTFAAQATPAILVNRTIFFTRNHSSPSLRPYVPSPLCALAIEIAMVSETADHEKAELG